MFTDYIFDKGFDCKEFLQVINKNTNNSFWKAKERQTWVFHKKIDALWDHNEINQLPKLNYHTLLLYENPKT